MYSDVRNHLTNIPYATIDEPIFIEGQIPDQGFINGQQSYTIRFYTPSGEKIAQESSNQYASKILPGTNWSLDERGSVDATIELASTEYRSLLNHRDVVQIHLNNDKVPIWRGFVFSKTLPIDTSPNTIIRATGFGAQLRWPIINGYTTGEYDIDDIIDVIVGIIDADTDINTDPAKVTATNDTVEENYVLAAVPIETALSQLAEIANTFQGADALFTYGVDETGTFYFKKLNGITHYHDKLVWGRHFAEVTGDEDSSNIVNQVWARVPDVTGIPHPSVPKGVWHTPYEDATSISTYRYRARFHNAPSSMNIGDSLRAAQSSLRNELTPRQTIRLTDVNFFGKQIRCPGNVTIVGRDGVTMTAAKKSVRYQLNQSGGVDLSIDLGHSNKGIVNNLRSLASDQSRTELASRTFITAPTTP